jgi:S-adenosylmethionine-diacylglycerol 3-amino-3-carboxypropyl transferase
VSIPKKNGIQFSVVREDSTVEIELIKHYKIKRPILIASGGCSAFNISSVYPDIDLTLIEPNKLQIELIKKKAKVLRTQKKINIEKKFGIRDIGAAAPNLIESGNFETLFRQFRSFIFEFVADKNEIRKLLLQGTKKNWKILFQHPYWPVAFELFFSDSLLRTMFGDLAIQHAPKGSYPLYFRTVIEAGLLRADRANNYFLHHIFLGHYLNKKNALPRYLVNPPKKMNYQFVNKMALDVPSYTSFDFVGLSNIFDWSSEKEISKLANKITNELKPGAIILFRQLNSNKNFTKHFGPKIIWEDAFAKRLHRADQSLFYQSLQLGVKK